MWGFYDETKGIKSCQDIDDQILSGGLTQEECRDAATELLQQELRVLNKNDTEYRFAPVGCQVRHEEGSKEIWWQSNRDSVGTLETFPVCKFTGNLFELLVFSYFTVIFKSSRTEFLGQVAFKFENVRFRTYVSM